MASSQFVPGLSIEQVFMAESQSFFDLLTVEGQGCYIPAYQRPYAWDTDNVALRSCPRHEGRSK
jgi:hypothetical protein